VAADGGAVSPGDAHREWLASPCSSCSDSPCCRVVPLQRLSLETRSDLLRARSLLSYSRIELGLYDSGAWVLYYRSTCAHHDSVTGKCRVHGSSRQPAICRAYSPHNCWYRDAYAAGAGPRFLRLDLPRFAAILAEVGCDSSGEIRRVPSWETMLDRVSAVPLALDGPGCLEPLCPAVELPEGGSGGPQTDPCRFVSLPTRPPRKLGDLDLLAFQLGFPGVQLAAVQPAAVQPAVGEASWALVLETPCRWLGTVRCGRTGAPVAARRGEAAAARRVIRFDPDSFEAIRAGFRWDASRGRLAIPSLSQMRRLLGRIRDRDPEDRPRPRSA